MISAEDGEKRKQIVEHATVGDTVFTVIVEENPNTEDTALDVVGTIIKNNTGSNLQQNKGRICYLKTDGG